MNQASLPSILFILTFPPPDHGSTFMNQNLWNSEIQNKFRCFLLDISDHRDLTNIGRIDWHNIFLAIIGAIGLIKILREKKPQLIYLPVSQNLLAFCRDGLYIHLARWFAPRSQRPKIVIHLHGSRFRHFYEEASWWFKLFIQSALRKVDSAIVLSQALSSIFSPWIKKIFVVPNGLDLIAPKSLKEKIDSLKKETQAETKIPVVTFLSNLLIAKGILDFLEAIPLVKAQNPDVCFKIAGEIWPPKKQGNQKVSIEKKLASITALPGVEYLGPVRGEEKIKLLEATDIFVLPSYDEGQPLSLIEAMAAGCAIIATSVGAIPETISDGNEGLLIPPGNPQLLAAKINLLLSDAVLRKRLALRARLRYEKNYTKERFIAKMMETLLTIIKNED